MEEFDDQNEVLYVYLEVEDLLSLYADIFKATEQEARNQLRSLAGIEGALARPHNHAVYENADLALQAAVLAHGIAEGQYFIEGNKRLALVAMLTFLFYNGYTVATSQSQRFEWMRDLSAGKTEEELAADIRAALVPVA
jgi:death-on-curing family protein